MNQNQNSFRTHNQKYNAQRKARKRGCFLAMVIFIISCAIAWLFLAETLTNTLPITKSSDLYKISQDLSINSANAVLIDLKSGKVLFDKNSTTRMYPASMTKIMTAIIVLERTSDLNEKVLLNKEMFHTLYNENASMAGFLPGERVSIIDLLNGLLLPSGAECAVGLSEYIAGSEDDFVSLMNEKAKEIGMNDSHFTNTTGLHNKNHYSTAMDIAVLLKYALNNDTFYKIFTSAQHSTMSTNRHDDGITYYSTLFSRIESPDFSGGSILGGKTGYTPEAGQCLASLAVKNNKYYILVTSGADGDSRTQKLHIDDAFKIYGAIHR